MIYDVKISARKKENLRAEVERYYIVQVNHLDEVNAKAHGPALTRMVIIDLIKIIRKTRMAF